MAVPLHGDDGHRLARDHPGHARARRQVFKTRQWASAPPHESRGQSNLVSLSTALAVELESGSTPCLRAYQFGVTDGRRLTLPAAGEMLPGHGTRNVHLTLPSSPLPTWCLHPTLSS